VTAWLVVGAGAAGCVVAARTSDDPDDRVVVLEAGPDHGVDPLPGDVGPLVGDPARVHGGVTVVRRPGDPPQAYVQGRGLGGSSLVNASIVVPTSDAVDGDPAGGHALPLEPPWALGGVGAAMLAADPDAAPLLLVRRGGRRVTAADAYLRPVLDRSNLTVLADAPVARLLVEGRRVVGAVTTDGTEHRADRTVVCAGAIHTPALLLRSGIDTEGIGEGLQDHPAFAIALELRPAAIDPSAPSITVSVERPGRQILGLNHVTGRSDLGLLLAGLTVVTSVGRISVPDPDGSVLVELHQLDTPADVDGITTVTLEALALLDEPPMRAIVAAAHVDDLGTPAEAIAGDPAAVRAWVPEHLTGFHHVAGSCRSGVVTDAHGRVRGYDGLLVVDASLFPGVPSHNPYLSVIRLAERLTRSWRSG
jgi:choline dehydrogenase/5-(hydroxymethyl)furfural/furfural oxidase